MSTTLASIYGVLSGPNTPPDNFPCDVCQRAGGLVQVVIKGERIRSFCSQECAGIAMTRDITTDENKAIEFGGTQAGAYLESIGQFNLMELTAEQWAEFCAILFASTCEDLKRQASEHIPF